MSRWRSRGWTAALALLSLAAITTHCLADLQPQQVCLLWNSHSANSAAIREAYIAARPGVREFDLGLSYVPQMEGARGGTNDATELFITPEAFDELVRPALLEFLYEEAPDVRCFVTTRGLPVLVTSQFNPPMGHENENGVVSSFEGALSVAGIMGAVALREHGSFANPFFGRTAEGFSEFLEQECIERRIFMISRLDTHAGGGEDVVDEIVQMIERSVNLSVNKFEATIVFDDVAGGCAIVERTRAASKRMRSRRWPVYYDGGDAFLHGANLVPNTGDCPCPSKCESLTVESAYVAYPELVHAGMGRTHATQCGGGANRECVSRGYVAHYLAHPAGMFFSAESFNGVSLWRSPASHGNALRWINDAGGSFTVAHSYGPTTAGLAQADFAVENFYVHGLTWAESVCSSMPRLGYVIAPIGDPLATVTVYDPDLNADGRVDSADLLILQRAAAGDATEIDDLTHADINGDGSIDEGDMQILLSVLNRPVSTDADNPIPSSTLVIAPSPGWIVFSGLQQPLLCQGDVNGDYAVDFLDADMVQQAVPCNCQAMDVNDDGTVDEADIVIASDPQTIDALLDVNQDGGFNCGDLFLSYQTSCNANCDPQFDLNCDGVVGFDDTEIIADQLLNLDGVESFFDLDYNANGFPDCADLQMLRDQYEPWPEVPATDPAFDLNGDGAVNCDDEWLFEWVLLIFNQPLCDGLGCLECPPVCLPVNPDCPPDIMPDNRDGTYGDGKVSIPDIIAITSAMGPCPDPDSPCPADVNGDCNVDVTDALIVLTNFGLTCP